MAGFARFISAVVVAVALISAQIMPAWAGCHSQRYAAAKSDIVKSDVFRSHLTTVSPATTTPFSLALADQSHRSTDDICVGNCGCACGLGGAFVLATITAIDAPLAVKFDPEFAVSNLPLGNQPESMRRPPRTAA